MQIGSQAATAFKVGAQDVLRGYIGSTLLFGTDPNVDTDPPVVVNDTYNDTTKEIVLELEDETPPITVYWAWIADPNTADEADIENGTGDVLEFGTFQTASGFTSNEVTVTDPAGDKILYFTEDSLGNRGSVRPLTGVTFVAPATLTNVVDDADGETGATWGVTSDTASGTIYAGLRLDTDPKLDAADIIATTGNCLQTDTDATPTADANNGGTFSGLTAGTGYVVDVTQDNGFGDITVSVAGDGFTTGGQPVAANAIADQTYTENVDPGPLDVAADFTGADTYALAPSSDPLPTGRTLNTSTGEITGTPTTPAAQVNIVVRGTDTTSGLTADTAFGVTVEAASSQGVLDDYPGAVGAWSLRKLSSSTTNVARLRNTDSQAEQDFTADEITDGTLATFAAGGDDVTVVTMYDQSGNGNDLTQSVASDQPFVVEGGTINLLNGRAAARYNGSLHFLETSSQLITTNTWHMFCHFRKAAGAISGSCLLSQHLLGNTGRVMFLRDNSDTISTFINNGTTFSPTSSISISAAGVPQVGETRAVSNDYAVAKDGGAFETVISGEALTPLNEPFRVGANDGGNGGFWAGRIGDVIVYDSDQTSNRAAIVSDIENA